MDGQKDGQSETNIPPQLCWPGYNEVHDNKSNPFFKKKSMDRNILGRWTNIETIAHTLIILYQVNIANIQYRITSVRNGQAIIGHPFPHQLNI